MWASEICGNAKIYVNVLRVVFVRFIRNPINGQIAGWITHFQAGLRR